VGAARDYEQATLDPRVGLSQSKEGRSCLASRSDFASFLKDFCHAGAATRIPLAAATAAAAAFDHRGFP
jgi:hypothetical protein